LAAFAFFAFFAFLAFFAFFAFGASAAGAEAAGAAVASEAGAEAAGAAAKAETANRLATKAAINLFILSPSVNMLIKRGFERISANNDMSRGWLTTISQIIFTIQIILIDLSVRYATPAGLCNSDHPIFSGN
jgi:hypothetical protein